MLAHSARIGDGLQAVCGRAVPFNGADVVEPFCGVVHDDCGALGHRACEAIDLSDAGGDLLLALRWVSRDVSGFDLLTAHVGDIRAVEIPTDANDVAIESVCRIRPAAPGRSSGLASRNSLFLIAMVKYELVALIHHSSLEFASFRF